MSNLVYLILAYSAVWVVLTAYIFILVMRNRHLQKLVDDLASRVDELENRSD